ncbi:RNA-directed DNA polymerase, eukaryota, reverse transcriptase zinc-binding domain protein [Tanacetum coccineum]
MTIFADQNVDRSKSYIALTIHNNVLGVGVSDMEVSNMVKLIGCGVSKFPLKYLGVPVGCNMASSSLSPWGSILKTIYRLKRKGIDLLSFCSRSIGNGVKTKFWTDLWHGDKPLKAQFHRIFLLDSNRDCLVANRIIVPNWLTVLRRCPRGGVESSQLESLHAILKDVLIKLLLVGIDVGSVLCPICQDDVESINHTFFSCEMAKVLWDLLARWWELDIPVCANISEWYSWLDSLHAFPKVRSFLEGVGGRIELELNIRDFAVLFKGLPATRCYRLARSLEPNLVAN